MTGLGSEKKRENILIAEEKNGLWKVGSCLVTRVEEDMKKKNML